MFWLKAIISGLLVAGASDVGRRNATLGGLIGSLPLVSILAMIWMWRGGSTTAHLAAYSFATFWFVLPSLPMFLLMAALFRAGWGFWPTLTAGCTLTIALYLLTMWGLPKLGVTL
jgi:succinate-acetate transporter protein